jgi:hypothetical protein
MKLLAILILLLAFSAPVLAQSEQATPTSDRSEVWRLRRELREAKGAADALDVQLAALREAHKEVRDENADTRRRLADIEWWFEKAGYVIGGLITILFGPHGKTALEWIAAMKGRSKTDDSSGN